MLFCTMFESWCNSKKMNNDVIRTEFVLLTLSNFNFFKSLYEDKAERNYNDKKAYSK